MSFLKYSQPAANSNTTITQAREFGAFICVLIVLSQEFCLRKKLFRWLANISFVYSLLSTLIGSSYRDVISMIYLKMLFSY